MLENAGSMANRFKQYIQDTCGVPSSCIHRINTAEWSAVSRNRYFFVSNSSYIVPSRQANPWQQGWMLPKPRHKPVSPYALLVANKRRVGTSDSQLVPITPDTCYTRLITLALLLTFMKNAANKAGLTSLGRTFCLPPLSKPYCKLFSGGHPLHLPNKEEEAAAAILAEYFDNSSLNSPFDSHPSKKRLLMLNSPVLVKMLCMTSTSPIVSCTILLEITSSPAQLSLLSAANIICVSSSAEKSNRRHGSQHSSVLPSDSKYLKTLIRPYKAFVKIHSHLPRKKTHFSEFAVFSAFCTKNGAVTLTGDIGKTFSRLKNLAVLQGLGTKNPQELGYYKQMFLTTCIQGHLRHSNCRVWNRCRVAAPRVARPVALYWTKLVGNKARRATRAIWQDKPVV